MAERNKFARMGVLAIVNDLKSRSGLGDEWRRMDESIQLQIIEEWVEVLVKAVPKPPLKLWTMEEMEVVVWGAWDSGAISNAKVAELLDFHVLEFEERLLAYNRKNDESNSGPSHVQRQ